MDLLALPWFELAAAALILCGGAIVQSAVGFGMALFVVPLLLWVGFSLPEAVATVIGAAFVQTAHGTWTAREDINWRFTLRFAGVQWLFIPLGVLGMYLLGQRLEVDVIKQGVGGLIFGLLLLRLLARPEPRERVAAGWTVLAGAATGILAGLVGMPGPPMALYALAHDWPKQRFRGFLWSQFVLGLPVLLGLLAWRVGVEVLLFTALGLVCLPLVYLGSILGLRLSRRWETAQLQKVATGLMFVIALWSMLAPLFIAG